MDVGRALKELRKEKGITQNELGDRTGIAQAYIGAIERGLRNPTTKTLEKILSKLDTTYIDFLVDYCGIKKETEPESTIEQSDTVKDSLNVGRALKYFREEQAITQTEWAEKSGINRNYISDAENGRNNPSRETITRLVEPFDVSYIHFLFKYCSEEMVEKSEEPNATEEYYTLFDLLNEENQKQATDFVEFLISKQRSK